MQRDRNLLFGIFAVQLNKVTASQIMEAGAAWAVDQSRDLPSRLVDAEALSEKDRKLIDRFVDEAVAAHGDDTSDTLKAFGGEEQVYQSFRGSVVLTESGGAADDMVGGESATISRSRSVEDGDVCFPVSFDSNGLAAGETAIDINARLQNHRTSIFIAPVSIRARSSLVVGPFGNPDFTTLIGFSSINRELDSGERSRPGCTVLRAGDVADIDIPDGRMNRASPQQRERRGTEEQHTPRWLPYPLAQILAHAHHGSLFVASDSSQFALTYVVLGAPLAISAYTPNRNRPNAATNHLFPIYS